MQEQRRCWGERQRSERALVTGRRGWRLTQKPNATYFFYKLTSHNRGKEDVRIKSATYIKKIQVVKRKTTTPLKQSIVRPTSLINKEVIIVIILHYDRWHPEHRYSIVETLISTTGKLQLNNTFVVPHRPQDVQVTTLLVENKVVYKIAVSMKNTNNVIC